jgi:hypothetical protein
LLKDWEVKKLDIFDVLLLLVKQVDGDMMKIAYLILAHTHPLHLTRLISALHTEHAHIFLHIDKKSQDMICLPITNTITLIKNTVTVNWGGFSVVQATLNLSKEATASGEYDYFILLSVGICSLRGR